MTDLVVYTSVFGHYDRVLPPVQREAGVRYVLVTDDPTMEVSGWEVKVIDTAPFGSATLANRHYKMLAHENFPDCAASVYVDGNIRVLGPLSPLVDRLRESARAMGAFRHPVRSSVREEIEACVLLGKVLDRTSLEEEFAFFRADGFVDNQGLIEASVLVRDHRHAALGPAMALWWSLFERFRNRDQISLPYVLWKTGLPCLYLPGSFREPNPWFGPYPHVGASGVRPAYAYVCARAYDSRWYRGVLAAWRLKWAAQRWLRRWLGRGA